LKLRQRENTENLLTSYHKFVTFKVPNDWQGTQYYRVDGGNLVLKLEDMRSPSYEIFISNSTILAELPTVAGDKKLTFMGEGKFSGRIVLRKSGPTYRLIDKGHLLKRPQSGMITESPGEYLVKGEKEGEVVVLITPPRFASARDTLEVIIVN
jgi:hypothetical protein